MVYLVHLSHPYLISSQNALEERREPRGNNFIKMVDEGPSYSVTDFINEMLPFNLGYTQPKAISQMWVFWSQQQEQEDYQSPHHTQNTIISSPCGNLGSGTEPPINKNSWGVVRDYVKHALHHFEYNTKDPNFLIQIWVPTTTTIEGEHCLLTTKDQPFGLYRIDRGLCEYRKHCMSLKFNCPTFYQDDEQENVGDQIGQVFRHKTESTVTWESCTTNYHPPSNFAYKYGIRSSLLLPIFKPFGRCCAGVLELVDTFPDTLVFNDPHSLAKSIFKVGSLIDPSPFNLPGIIEDSINEISKALQVVCTELNLPLAHIWVPCCTDNHHKSCYSSYLTCSRKFSSKYNKCNIINFTDVKNINLLSERSTLRKGQGVVGKAFLYRKPYFCADVSKRPVAEYPLCHVARAYGLMGCYAFCIQSSNSRGNHDYVLEFFLPPLNSDMVPVNQVTFLEVLFAMVKNQLPGFEICSGAEASVEVVCQTAKDNGSNIFGLEQNGATFTCLEKIVGRELLVEAAMNGELTKSIPPLLITSPDEIVLVQLSSDDESTMAAVRNNKVHVIAKQNSLISNKDEASEDSEYRTTDISLTREDLIKHFGKKLDDAADILRVSRSTMKRACRVHGIKKWPIPRRKKINPSPSNLKFYKSFQCGDEQYSTFCSREPSCSPSSVTTRQDEGRVTVKATFGADMIRFPLSLPSRKVDLMKNVIQRLQLKDGTFTIKYEDEDGDWVLIACNEDLKECIRSSKGNRVIKMSVQSIASQA